MEALRQPSAQPRAFGTDAPRRARLDGPVLALVLDPVRGGIILIPSLITSLQDLLRRPAEVLPLQHLAAAGRFLGRRLALDVFTLACLPYEAFFSLDAVVRTAARTLVSHKRLLEWNPSGDADRKDRTGLAAVCRTMWFAPVLAAALALSGTAALGAAGLSWRSGSLHRSSRGGSAGRLPRRKHD